MQTNVRKPMKFLLQLSHSPGEWEVLEPSDYSGSLDGLSNTHKHNWFSITATPGTGKMIFITGFQAMKSILHQRKILPEYTDAALNSQAFKVKFFNYYFKTEANRNQNDSMSKGTVLAQYLLAVSQRPGSILRHLQKILLTPKCSFKKGNKKGDKRKKHGVYTQQ